MSKATKQENFIGYFIFTGKPQPTHLTLSGSRGTREARCERKTIQLFNSCTASEAPPEQLRVLDHAHEGGPQRAAVQLVADLGDQRDGARLLPLGRRVEQRLVLVRVELGPHRVQSEQAVLFKHLLNLHFCHDKTFVQALQVRVFVFNFFFGNAFCCFLQNVCNF